MPSDHGDSHVPLVSLSAAQIRDQRMREAFEKDTAEHVMTVLRDDGLYRHLRFARPGTQAYLYDLVTWPGNLVICGDVDALHFARIPDMFDFFVPADYSDRWPINPQYWAEKLQGRRAQAEEFSPDAYVERVREWSHQRAEEMEPDAAREFLAAVAARLIRDPEDDWGEGTVVAYDRAYELLRDFEHNGIHVYDPTDWECRDYTPAFLWNCWAIVRGIQRFRQAALLEPDAEGGEHA